MATGVVPEGSRIGRAALVAVLAAGLCLAQEKGQSGDPFQHYAAARQHLAAGAEGLAAGEFRLFLGSVLHGTATAAAEASQFAQAASLFEAALSFSPDDAELRMDYARALFNLTKFREAKDQAQQAVRLEPQNPRAILLLGQMQYQLRDFAAAIPQLETAYAKDPQFATAYLLGKCYLLQHDEKAARSLFDSMLRQWGDTDVNHIFIGRAYSQTGDPNEAAAEFRKAMELNPKARGAHYQLALSYLREDEAAGYDKAVPEFRAELASAPDDFPSHYMLGYIAVKQAKWDEAEKELLRAIALNPKDLPSLLALGETYNATGRPKDAESILRQALTVAGRQTTPEVGRAHYLLGRILVAQPGHQDEAKREMAAAAEIQKHSGTVLTADARAVGAGSLLRQEAAMEATAPRADATTSGGGPESIVAEQVRTAIADAYNNLGVIAGNRHDFESAANYFRRARQWNPPFPGLDHNLGMALFYSSQYREAAPLLKTYVESNPDDVGARGALGFSLFQIEDFAGVVAALHPIRDQMNQTPKLAFAYAASLARTGADAEGIERLKALEAANPNSAEIHYELSLAYQHSGQTEDAERETKLYQRLKK